MAAALSDTPALSTPVKLMINSRADLDAGVALVLGAAQRALRCAAAYLSVFGLSTSAATVQLRALLHSGRMHQVRLLVDDLQWIETRAPRLKALQREFPHALLIRVADREDAVGDDAIVLADDRHTLQLRPSKVVHGEMWLNNGPYAQPLLAAFDRRWDRAAHNAAVAPLGL